MRSLLFTVFFLFIFVMADAQEDKGFEFLDENLRLLYQHEISNDSDSTESSLESALKIRKQRKENIVEQYWEMINEEWRYFTETRYIYNEEGIPEKTILFNYKEKYKVQSGLDELTHDDEGRLIRVLQKRDFDLDQTVRLKNYKIYSYQYDDKGNIQEELLKIWDRFTWKNENIKRYSYNYRNDITELREFKWDGRDWMIKNKTKYQYNDNDQVELEIHEEYFQGQVFSTMITENEFNEENRLSESLVKSGVMGQWKLKEFLSFQYDKKGNMVQKLVREFVKGNWVNRTAFLYVYDKRDTISKIFEKKWTNDEEQSWLNSKKTEYYYKLVK